MGDDYLQRILTARCTTWRSRSRSTSRRACRARLGNQVLLKREDQQPVFSFKLRGAYNKMANLSARQLARGVICAAPATMRRAWRSPRSAWAAARVIVMPVTTPRIKVDAVRARGGEVGAARRQLSTRPIEHALRAGARASLTFVHPFDDPQVIAGQGTIGMEILRQHPAPIDAIFVPVGGGGLIAGIAAYVKRVAPDVRIIGVSPWIRRRCTNRSRPDGA